MASYVEILKDINLHKWLKNTLETLTIPSSDMKKAEIEALQNSLKSVTKEIVETKEQIQNILGFIIRTTDADRAKMNQHQKLVEDYLTHTAQECSELRKMLDVLNAKTLSTNRDNIVASLSKEASLIDEATEGLLLQ